MSPTNSNSSAGLNMPCLGPGLACTPSVPLSFVVGIGFTQTLFTCLITSSRKLPGITHQRFFFNVTQFAANVSMGDPIAGTMVYVGNTTAVNSTSGNGTSSGGYSPGRNATSAASANWLPSTYFLALACGGAYALL